MWWDFFPNTSHYPRREDWNSSMDVKNLDISIYRNGDSISQARNKEQWTYAAVYIKYFTV
jgi:hypothetical protein